MLVEQKQGPRHSILIAVLASQGAGIQTDPAVQQVTTAKQVKDQVSQSTHSLTQSDKSVRIGKARHSHVIVVCEVSRPISRKVNPITPMKIILLRKQY